MNRDTVYLRHMLEAIGKIENYVSVGRDEFMDMSHWQDGVIRQLEIIGEATKKLSQDIRRREKDIPWRRIAGLRDVLIHDYMGVDLSAVWEITQEHIPILKKSVLKLLDTQ